MGCSNNRDVATKEDDDNEHKKNVFPSSIESTSTVLCSLLLRCIYNLTIPTTGTGGVRTLKFGMLKIMVNSHN